MAAFTLRITDELNDKLEVLAKDLNITKNAYINLVLNEKVKREEKKIISASQQNK